MEISTNPAHRLQTLIADGNTLAQRVWSDSQHQLLISNAWRTLLGSETSTTSDLLHCHAFVLDLIQEVRIAISSVTFDGTDIALTHINLVESVFAHVTIFDPWRILTDGIKERTWEGLEFCVAVLDGFFPPLIHVSQGDFNEILAGISSLTRDTKFCNIDPILKSLIIRNLEILARRFCYFRISGHKGLQLAFEANLGSVLLHQKLIKELLTSSDRVEEKKNWRKFQKILERVALLIGMSAYNSEPMLERLFNPFASIEPTPVEPM